MRLHWSALLVCSMCWTACDSSDPSPAADGGEKDAGEKDAGEKDAGPAQVRKLDRSGFKSVAASGHLDYATPEHWVCRPDIDPDECAGDIDATEIKPDGTLAVHEHEPADKPEFDCFYVYPTVWIGQTAQMTDFSASGVKMVLDPLLAQAARFTSLCRMYAPMYRQAGLAGASLQPGADKQLALQDVRDAFKYYLEHDSKGRKFVLLGHSQGAYMLTSMIARDIDEKPELRARMISAVLLGAQPYAPPGKTVGGSFKNITACTEPGQTGCVIAFNSFPVEAPPKADALVGHVTDVFANEPVDTSGQVFCTEPAALAKNTGRYLGSYFPLMLNNAMFGTPKPIDGVTTPFALWRDLFRGHCVYKDGLSYLEVSSEPGTDSKLRAQPEYRSTLLESIGFGTHLVDYDLALEDLLKAVELQAKAAK
ncbi:MAG TPA: DUF3089 domain-containing protein [Polyangiales bacterium]|nr:DUF3089 domain-containing protein [Polyangiales bacterium]